jgi:hypothetical protein
MPDMTHRARRVPADAWHQSERIRAFLAAAREARQRDQVTTDPDSDIGRWLTWAADYADSINPLKHR